MKIEMLNREREPVCEGVLITQKDNLVTFRTLENASDTLESEAYLVLYDSDRGLMVYDSELYHIVEENVYVYKLLELVEVIQRRSDVKVRIHYNTKISVRGFSADAPEEFPGTVTDLSASGLRIVLSRDVFLRVGQRFFLEFTLLERPISLLCEVVRSEPAGEEHLGYGCRFVNLKPGTESALRRFVFQKQAQLRRRSID